MKTNDRARILCVDDELDVIESLKLHLHRRFDVETASSGIAALAILRSVNDISIVMSDMRMPGMDGVTLLAQAKQIAPDAVRILLTGQADLGSAIASVNEGHIFRFLTKPCPPPTLLVALDAAVEQHRLITAERVLLEQTLHGCIKTLTEVLSLTSPISFGRATRIKQYVSELANELGLRERWQVEVAAMLSQLGCITLPTETVEKVYYGKELSTEEQKMVSRLPGLTEQLLGNIPRLEAVREILATYSKPLNRSEVANENSQKLVVIRGAQLLKVAVDFDELEAQGNSKALSLDTMRGRPDRYDPEVLAALVAICRVDGPHANIRELPVSSLRVGMMFAEDVKMHSGTLLVARGSDVTAGFLERIRNFRPGTIKEPVRVIIKITDKELQT